ncbi:MAG: hypothetical protein ACFCVG_18920 [Kineosporiaceae bacterium]
MVDVWKALPGEGAVGRVHLFVVPGEDLDDGLADFVALAVMMRQSQDPLADLDGDFCTSRPQECLREIAYPQEDVSAWPPRTPQLEAAIDRRRS